MSKRKQCFAILCILCVGAATVSHAEEFDFFEKRVRPLLVKRCYKCHSGTKTSGGLSLQTAAGWRKGGKSGSVIVPGKPGDSSLIDAVNYRELEMPPKNAGGKLSKEEIAVLTKWIADGAKDPRTGDVVLGGMSLEQAKSWWSFQSLPAAQGSADPKRIDEFLNAAIKKHSLTRTKLADKRTLIRRATYDLTGLPPTPEEVKAFLEDNSPAAFDKVIDRLLDSPDYGVRWGRHWLDVVRYADTAGENSDHPLPHAWRYRNWVLNSLNRDMPFDHFARMQICGDILAKESKSENFAENTIATGYLAVARRYGHNIDKDIHLMHEDVIDNLGKNFLGLTLGCARCHDHKYDPVTSEDYYALYGIFNSTRFSFPGCEPIQQPRDLVPLIEKAKVDALMNEYNKRMQRYKQRSKLTQKETKRLKALAANCYKVLSKAGVPEGKSTSIHERQNGALDKVKIRKGEVLQLAVLRNGNYGADTTRLEWEITRLSDGARWDIRDIIPTFTKNGPIVESKGATWCFLDVTDGPKFLGGLKLALNGRKPLNAWAIGDNPAVFINSSKAPISAWTKLPANSVFVHPGPAQDVGVAWVCPADGEYRIRGTVIDSHPAGGLDGVSFRIEHLADAEFGKGLIALGKQVAAKAPTKPVIPVGYAAVEAKPKNVRLHRRGDPEQPGKEIQRRWLSVFGGEQVGGDAGSGRRELANWITKHPLMARVMVNRIWQWHFGRGIVATANDFGSRGTAPTHPKLLDWLAARFKATGYRLKPMHRLIMKSAAYQRSSDADAAQVKKDPDNQWLSYFSRRRLSAEEIRDSLLTAAGELDRSFGKAHPFPAEATWGFSQHAPFNAVYPTSRRSVFMMVQRQRRHPFLSLFDGADPNSSTAKRDATTVATQALYFLNDPFFHKQSLRMAETVLKSNKAARVQYAFQRVFQRVPATMETKIAMHFLKQYPGSPKEKWAAYGRVLMSSNEFMYID